MVSILGHLWFRGFITNEVRFLSPKSNQVQGELDSFYIYTLELVLTYILRVMTVSSLNLSAFRHLHILRVCVLTNEKIIFFRCVFNSEL